MKIVRTRYNGFDDAVVASKHGPSTWLGDVCVGGNYQPISLYRAHAPDKSRGHKPYFGLFIETRHVNSAGLPPSIVDPVVRTAYICGFSHQAARKVVNVDGVSCKVCLTAVFSPMRHACVSCECGAITVDGGRDYRKVSSDRTGMFRYCNINLSSGVVTHTPRRISRG